MQTLVDLVTTNTLIIQSIDIILHVVLHNFSFMIQSPIDELIASFITVIINIVTLTHTFFLLFNVLTKYVCIFFSWCQEMIQDHKVINGIWIFSLLSSTILIFMEFTFIHDIKSMIAYNTLRKNCIDYKQEPRYFVNVVFGVTLLLYTFLQIKVVRLAEFYTFAQLTSLFCFYEFKKLML